MINKPVVFISSTSDLRSARDLVGKVLYSMGYEPIWQDVAATDGGELLDVLRSRITPCQMMIQLVGSRYGAESPAPSPEFGRVSYTQFEAMFAERHGKKVVYHFLTNDFPTDTTNTEASELADLQSKYRQRIIDINKLHQANITSPQDLELSIRRIRDELSAVRMLSDARFRKVLLLAAGSLAGLAALAILLIGGFALLRSRQREQTAKMDQQTAKAVDQSGQLDRIEKLLNAQQLVNPKAVPQLSVADQAILDEAKKQGDLKSRATASVLQPDAQTDALLDQLRAHQTAQAFDLAMLEGKRWLFGERRTRDRTIPFFEHAVQLRPDSFDARNFLGIAWANMPTGWKGDTLRKAISVYRANLKIFCKETDPNHWAITQGNIGGAWLVMPSHEDEFLRNAANVCDQSLTVLIVAESPGGWAPAQIDLPWWMLPISDGGENTRKAISAYEAALTVWSKTTEPNEWARAQNNLAFALEVMARVQGKDRSTWLGRAIACDKAALSVYTAETFPSEHAYMEKNLADHRKAYEVTAGAATQPFEKIAPAE